VPRTSNGRSNASPSKSACWPGTSSETPPSSDAACPRPGRDVIAAGVPAGGFAIFCASPVSGKSSRRRLWARPRYSESAKVSVVARLLRTLMPPRVLYVKLPAGFSPLPAT
jgi:hypothetical protein